MKLYIKYMVSTRCKTMVKTELDNLGLHYRPIDLGEVEVEENITAEQRSQLKFALSKLELELMDDRKAIMIEKIKQVIVEMVPYPEDGQKTNFSVYLSKHLNRDYNYLAHLFSEVTGNTIEHYLIGYKIERVKGLLLCKKLNLTQISYQLNYSSVAHLSRQFKQATGITPSCFKKLQQQEIITHENMRMM